MDRIKLMTIVGTRPEIIKLSETIKKCDQYFNHILVHTGQNWDYTLNQIFFQELGIRSPDFYLDSVGKDLGDTLGNILSKSYSLFVREKPDALLILGDTNSALSAISAKRLKIPIFHMEAGNRCFDENLPEEVNRRIIDHISDINLPYTEHARRYLYTEGIAKERIFVTGSPMAEVLRVHRMEIEASNVLESLELEKGKYILLSAHREENIDIEKNFIELTDAINQMAERYQMPIIYSMHPRSEKVMKKSWFLLPRQYPRSETVRIFRLQSASAKCLLRRIRQWDSRGGKCDSEISRCIDPYFHRAAGSDRQGLLYSRGNRYRTCATGCSACGYHAAKS